MLLPTGFVILAQNACGPTRQRYDNADDRTIYHDTDYMPNLK